MNDKVTITEARAARLSGLTVRRMRDWADKDIVGPSTARRLPGRWVRHYDFDALVELLVAARIREHVSLQHLRKVLEHLRSRGHDRPLREIRFAVSGRDIYFQSADGTWEGGRAPGQAVIETTIPLDEIRAAIRDTTRRQAGTVGVIERRRGVQGSRPVFAGTRIPVSAVTNYLNSGYGDQDILTAYPDLHQSDIDAARRLPASA